MRNLRSGTMIEHRFSSEDRVEKAVLEEVEMEYLYDDGEFFYFMNTQSFEQMHLTRDLLGDAVSYLIPSLHVHVEFYEGKPMSVELPATVDMTVVETEPGLRGATVSNVTKPAKLETGLVVQVPPFISEGEKIRVNTPRAPTRNGPDTRAQADPTPGEARSTAVAPWCWRCPRPPNPWPRRTPPPNRRAYCP
jgi:elongation factor P